MATTTSQLKRSRKSRASHASGPGGPWSNRAPHRLRQHYQGLTDAAGWTLWRKHLAKRKLRAVAKLFAGRQSPLFWAVPEGADVDEARQIVESLRRRRAADRQTAGLDNAALCWLSRAEVAAGDIGFALECLAWGAALPQLAEHLEERLWWQLCQRLIAIATDGTPNDPLAVYLLHAELPVVLAYGLPELAEAGALVAISRRTLDEALIETADGHGLVDGRHLDALRPLLACWTRLLVVSRHLDESPWSDVALRWYGRLVEYALRLSRADGRQVFTPPESARLNRRLLKTALGLSDRAKTRRVARLLSDKPSAKPARSAPLPSLDLDAAGVAVLRSSWGRRTPQLAVNFSRTGLEAELSLGRRPLVAGTCELEVRIDGRPLTPRQPWEQICWESDDDVDYLELELVLSEDVTLQRHLALARKDRFLFVADAVLGLRPAQIEYRATLPLAAGIALAGASETREGTLSAGKRPLARVLPLALGEWRTAPTCGTLESSGDVLTWTQAASGQNLLAPLWIDLDPRRHAREVTWRQLTVGQNRAPVARDEAVGYRVQVGRSQWLVYRSLAEPGMRTVLGKNLHNEFLIGRFASTGKVKTILEIEA